MLVDVGGGTRLYVERVGHGPPFVVLHGGLGLDHTYLRAGLGPLADAVELIYVDLRGNGRSDRPTDWRRVDHGTWVEDIQSLRLRLGLDRILLFGHSYGGYLAQEYALRHPETLAGLLLCSTAPVMDFGATSMAALAEVASPEQLALLAESFSRPFVGDDQDFITLLRAALPLYFHAPSAERVEFVVREMRVSPEAFNRSFFQCLPDFDVRDRLPGVRVPTLVLGGCYDRIVPSAEGAERLARLIPNAGFVLFPQSGHFPFLEEPGHFSAIVHDWLRHLSGEQRPVEAAVTPRSAR